jgi:uncharacterized protein YhaN
VTKGKTFPKDIIEHWPEVFGEITLNVIPLKYLESITVSFRNKKIWEINMAARRMRDDWDAFEASLKEMLAAYESEIENVDFKLDTERVKKDMIKNTNKFLKRRKLK